LKNADGAQKVSGNQREKIRKVFHADRRRLKPQMGEEKKRVLLFMIFVEG
jgi:hypothetical protein